MVSRVFLTSSVLYGILGLLIGLHMAISEDHSQMPTHAHLMVVSWLSFFGFGLYYHQFQEAASGRAASIHFWLAQIFTPIMLFGVWSVHADIPAFEPLAPIGSIGYAISFLVFAIVVFKSNRN